MPTTPPLEFGHPPALLAQWRARIRAALKAGARTPFFVLSPAPIEEALLELEALDFGLPTRHWLSCKTQPVAPLLRWWKQQGRPIEVVSEFEFRAALAEGFDPGAILVNGPAKHRWLPGAARPGIRVHFDSLAEAKALAPLARKQSWQLGVRFHPTSEMDPENPDRPTQFGLDANELSEVLRFLKRAKLQPDALSFHLRTNIPDPSVYEAAITEASAVCGSCSFQPRILDCGGGLPPPYILMKRGRRYDAAMSLPALASMHRRNLRAFPGLQELWLENGRHLLARAGVLVVSILDSKLRKGVRQLICDGGRTLNALISTWEHHELLPVTPHRGPTLPTVVHGPTCMAFDQLGFRSLPKSLQPGEPLAWFDAGAYHIPWETHFSHGLAEVWWHESDAEIRCERDAESFESYWSRWKKLESPRIP